MMNTLRCVARILRCNQEILFLILLGLVIPQAWFRDSLIIAQSDNFTEIDPAGFSYLFYTRDTKPFALGGRSGVSLLFPWVTFWVCLERLGLSPWAIQQLWITGLFLLQLLAAYYVIRTLRFSKSAALVFSLFYSMNMFQLTAGPEVLTMRIVLAAAPLIVALWVKGLRGEAPTLNSFLLSLASLIIAPSMVDPIFALALATILGLWAIFSILLDSHGLIQKMTFIGQTLLFTIVINLWHLVVWLPNALAHSSIIRQQSEAYSQLGGSGGLVDFFRLGGYYAWHGFTWEGIPIFSFASQYDQMPLLLLTFALSASGWLTLLLVPRDRRVVTIAAIAVAGLTLAAGTTGPVGGVYKYLFVNLPYFWLFREPYTHFGMVMMFGVTALFGVLVDIVLRHVCRKHPQRFLRRLPCPAALLLVIVLILAAGSPILQGARIPDVNEGPGRSAYTQVPKYWNDIGHWFTQNDPTSTVLVIPGGAPTYNWEHGLSATLPVSIVLVPNPQLTSVDQTYDEQQTLVNLAITSLTRGDPYFFGWLTSQLGVKYILHQRDVAYVGGRQYDSLHMRDLLENNPYLSRVKTFGMLDVYQNRVASPAVYAASGFVLVRGNFEASYEALKPLVGKPDPFIISGQNSPETVHTLELAAYKSQSMTPTIDVVEVNPTLFRIKVSAQSPFILVTSLQYSDHWQLSIHSSSISLGSVEQLGTHFIVNGYANAWYVDRLGVYELSLVFVQQVAFTTSLVISATFPPILLLFSRRGGLHLGRCRWKRL